MNYEYYTTFHDITLSHTVPELRMFTILHIKHTLTKYMHVHTHTYSKALLNRRINLCRCLKGGIFPSFVLIILWIGTAANPKREAEQLAKRRSKKVLWPRTGGPASRLHGLAKMASDDIY